VIGPFAQGDATPAVLRAALDSVFASPAYRWTETPAPERWLRDSWQRLGDWLAGLRAGNPTVFRLLVFALLLALVAILAHGAWTVWRTVRGAAAPDDAARPRDQRAPRDAAWYLREADRAAAAGRTREALQLAFVALALTLDGQGLLRYHLSQTPAEVAREARLGGEERERLRGLVKDLYAHVFGGRPCSAEDYRRWRDATARPWHAAAH
jgi:Domain of unknown function (DUF4129)